MWMGGEEAKSIMYSKVTYKCKMMLNSFQRYIYKDIKWIGSVVSEGRGWGLKEENELIQLLCPNRWQLYIKNVVSNYRNSPHLRTKLKTVFLKDNGQLSIQQILSGSRRQTMY